VLDATTGAAAASADGKAVGDQTITIPTAGLDAGSYQYALRVFKCGKPGTSETRYSRSFALDSENPVSVPPELLGRPSLPTLLPTVKSAATTTTTTPPAATTTAAAAAVTNAEATP
jgi:hypothetical protein